MDPIVYFLADHYPWWGIPLALILAEMALRHRRRGYRGRMVILLFASVFFLALAGLYFFYNGMERLRPEMERLDKTYLRK